MDPRISPRVSQIVSTREYVGLQDLQVAFWGSLELGRGDHCTFRRMIIRCRIMIMIPERKHHVLWHLPGAGW